MSRFWSCIAASLVLVFGGLAACQATRDSRPALPKDPLTLMALPPAPDGVKEAKQPVVTIDQAALDTVDLAREIAALQWFPAVDALVRRRILDLELAAKKIRLSPDEIEREAVRILADLDSSAQWSHLASTNPAVSGALLAQARDAVGWERVGRRPDQQDDAEGGDNDAKKFLVAMEARRRGRSTRSANARMATCSPREHLPRSRRPRARSS